MTTTKNYIVVVANGPYEGSPVTDGLLIWHGAFADAVVLAEEMRAQARIFGHQTDYVVIDDAAKD